MLKIKKGDTVKVLSGNDKGKIGEVLEVIPKTEKILVKGVNIRKKHVKPRRQGEEGGIISSEFPIHSSKVNVVCPKCNKATRIGFEMDKENKIRVCKKCGTTYSQFKKTGKLGCGECYDSFKEELASKVQEIQGHTEHIGKIPVREEKKVISNKKVNELKKALQEAIIEEEYEKAAVIRDEIKFYESMKGSGVND